MSVYDELEKQRLAAEAQARGIPEWAADAARTVPDSLVRDIVSDFRRPLSQSASMIPQRRDADEQPRAASGGTVEVKAPPGVNLIDRMCEAQDRRDALVRMQQEAELRWIESKLEAKGPLVRHEYNPVTAHDAEMPSFHRGKK